MSCSSWQGCGASSCPNSSPAGTSLGPLRTDLADAWGLHRDVVVVAGTGDGQAAGIGLGVTDPGAAYLVLGTAVVIGSETTSYLPARAYRSMISAMPGQTTVETFSSSGTFLSTWFRKEFGDPELAGAPDPALERAAAAVSVGSERLLTLPYWNAAQTPHWDGRASGVTLGWQGCHTRAHFYRSLLEGIAFELRSQLDGLEQRARPTRRGASAPWAAERAAHCGRRSWPTCSTAHSRCAPPAKSAPSAPPPSHSTRSGHTRPFPKPRPQWPEPTQSSSRRPEMLSSTAHCDRSTNASIARPATSCTAFTTYPIFHRTMSHEETKP